MAEIGYVCLVETDLQLIGVVDAERSGRFFDLPITAPAQLLEQTLDGQKYDRLVVMSFGDTEVTTASLQQLGIPMTKVFWL